jgi:hypothetical protein
LRLGDGRVPRRDFAGRGKASVAGERGVGVGRRLVGHRRAGRRRAWQCECLVAESLSPCARARGS